MDTIRHTLSMGASSTPSKQPSTSIGSTSTANNSEEVEGKSLCRPIANQCRGTGKTGDKNCLNPRHLSSVGYRTYYLAPATSEEKHPYYIKGILKDPNFDAAIKKKYKQLIGGLTQGEREVIRDERMCLVVDKKMLQWVPGRTKLSVSSSYVSPSPNSFHRLNCTDLLPIK